MGIFNKILAAFFVAMSFFPASGFSETPENGEHDLPSLMDTRKKTIRDRDVGAVAENVTKKYAEQCFDIKEPKVGQESADNFNALVDSIVRPEVDLDSDKLTYRIEYLIHQLRLANKLDPNIDSAKRITNLLGQLTKCRPNIVVNGNPAIDENKLQVAVGKAMRSSIPDSLNDKLSPDDQQSYLAGLEKFKKLSNPDTAQANELLGIVKRFNPKILERLNGEDSTAFGDRIFRQLGISRPWFGKFVPGDPPLRGDFTQHQKAVYGVLPPAGISPTKKEGGIPDGVPPGTPRAPKFEGREEGQTSRKGKQRTTGGDTDGGTTDGGTEDKDGDGFPDPNQGGGGGGGGSGGGTGGGGTGGGGTGGGGTGGGGTGGGGSAPAGGGGPFGQGGLGQALGGLGGGGGGLQIPPGQNPGIQAPQIQGPQGLQGIVFAPNTDAASADNVAQTIFADLAARRQANQAMFQYYGNAITNDVAKLGATAMQIVQNVYKTLTPPPNGANLSGPAFAAQRNGVPFAGPNSSMVSGYIPNGGRVPTSTSLRGPVPLGLASQPAFQAQGYSGANNLGGFGRVPSALQLAQSQSLARQQAGLARGVAATPARGIASAAVASTAAPSPASKVLRPKYFAPQHLNSATAH